MTPLPQHYLFRRRAHRSRNVSDTGTTATSETINEGPSPSDDVEATQNGNTSPSNVVSSDAPQHAIVNDADEERELIVRIPTNENSLSNLNPLPADWDTNPAAQQHRRDAIRREVERVQRANFVHFTLLCLVPTSLLLIVIVAIVSEDGECSGDGLTECEREERSFVNAFTTRCICEAVRSVVVEDDTLATKLMEGNGDGL